MNIKGNIGDKVILSGQIKSIAVCENGVRYNVQLDVDKMSMYTLKESEFEFVQEKDTFETPEDIPQRIKRRVVR